MIPTAVSQGFVPNCLSATTPKIVNPMLGTNIRHVVSPIVLINKITVDLSGGMGAAPVGFGDVLMYLYTVTVNERIVNDAAKE